jgi:hypothetical protein
MTMLLDVIKARHDARTIYLYLQEGAISSTGGMGYYRRYRRSRYNAPQAPLPVHVDGMEHLKRHGATVDANVAVKDLKDQGQFVLPTGAGIADLSIILRQTAIVLSDGDFAKLNTDAMTQKKIASEFTKAMVKAVANRVFVTTVVPYLA